MPDRPPTNRHDEILELLAHLDGELAPVKAACDSWYDWSDGDKLRAIAHTQLQASHIARHLGEVDGLPAIREVLRIAVRLDLVDEQEAADG